jgi:hypothetical protein
MACAQCLQLHSGCSIVCRQEVIVCVCQHACSPASVCVRAACLHCVNCFVLSLPPGVSSSTTASPVSGYVVLTPTALHNFTARCACVRACVSLFLYALWANSFAGCGTRWLRVCCGCCPCSQGQRLAWQDQGGVCVLSLRLAGMPGSCAGLGSGLHAAVVAAAVCLVSPFVMPAAWINQ